MATIQREKTAVLSVSLPKDLRNKVVRYAKKNSITISQLIKQKLEAEMLIEEFEEISKPFRQAFKKLGIKTDEDVEKYFG